MELDAVQTTPPMSLRRAVGIYAGLSSATLVLAILAIGVSWFPGILYFIGYFAAGYILNRVVLRQLIEWHPVYNTLDNVATSKLKAFLFWPIAYASLFLKLAVNRVL